uniref:Uncharacterized protein n=1 Tax=Anguilla anguilla TaxID=7936 RepID=A0A0E9XK09_ANGAN
MCGNKMAVLVSTLKPCDRGEAQPLLISGCPSSHS